MALAVSCNNPPSPYIGQPYSHALSASGGTAPYTYTLSAGSLPPGLSLSSSGTISGRPKNTGSYAFTPKVTDAVSATATVACSVTVNIPAVPQPGFSLQKIALALKKDPRLPVRGAQ